MTSHTVLGTMTPTSSPTPGSSGTRKTAARKRSASAALAKSAAPAERRQVVARVVDDICDYVRENGLTVGSKLPTEKGFIELFGVGRSSLREALRVLSTMSVIDVRHGDGMYLLSSVDKVTSSGSALFDATEEHALRNLVETRLGVELAAVTAVTQRASDEDLNSLQKLLDEQAAQMADDPNFQWSALGFELAVVELSGNSWLYEIELMLRDAWHELSSGLRQEVGRHQEWHTEHGAILASMRSRNVRQAQRLVIAHLSLERFEDDLEERGRKRGSGARGRS